MTRIALLGDRSDHRSRCELNALRLQLSDQLGVESGWVGRPIHPLVRAFVAAAG